MEPTIKWNADLFGVEIQTKKEHFVISAQPSLVMPWYDAVRYFQGNAEWELPTKKQLKIVASNIDKINEIIKENGGYWMRGWYWTSEERDEFCAWGISMNDGYTDNYYKNYCYYVRAVSALTK